MRKRFLSLLLAGCMILTSAVPALANNVSNSDKSESGIVILDEEVADQNILEGELPEEKLNNQETMPEGTEDVTEILTKDEVLLEENDVTEVIEDEVVTETITDEDFADVETFEEEAGTIEPHIIDYKSHVANIGWMDSVSSEQYGEYSGTVGKNLWMESLKIDPKGLTGITYRAHVANIGWMDFVSADDSEAFAGTTGRALAMEAIEIKLEGENAEKYDIYYRAHVTNFGWLGWAKNGESAGSAGYAYTLQALEIKVLPKGMSPEGYDAEKSAFEQKLKFYQKAQIQNLGWTSNCEFGPILGTTGRNLYLEGIQLKTNDERNIGIAYSTHVSNLGWTAEVENGVTSGKKGLPIEAIKIRLTGKDAEKYDIYYQAHVSNMGWLDWAKNGEAAGSSGLANSMQALRLVVVEKGAAAPGNNGFAFASKAALSSQGYSKTKGWLPAVSSGAVIGTTGKALPLQGLKINLSGVQNTSIQYSAHVSNVGWQTYAVDGATAGLPARNEQIEAIKIELSGRGSKYYDIWYRVHAANIGWLDWAKNGEQAGTAKLNYAAEAIQVVILPKNSAAPGATEQPFINTRAGWVYINGYRRYRDERGNILSDVSHLFNPGRYQITVDCYRGITTIYGYNSQTGQYDTPIKAFWCSVGRGGEDKTPTGEHSIYRKYASKVMRGTSSVSDEPYEVWAPYISCFKGPIYFHGVASIDTSKYISRDNWLGLGTPRSAGCVRLAGIEAKWIYENCPIGTKVIVGSYSTPMDCPITNPIRYAWTGGSVGFDPTLYPNKYPN